MNHKQSNGHVIINGKIEENGEEHCCWDVPAIKKVPAISSTPSSGNISKLNSLDCWDYTIELECLQGPQDLQLAAELGKTLLERNKELETTLKHHQNVIDDQAQEIEYLQKQTAALREVNDSRLRIYEQLEVGIQDLERANHRLMVENTTDKKHIKSLLHNIEGLESRYEELTRSLEEAKKLLSLERRKNERLREENSQKDQQGVVLRHVGGEDAANGDLTGDGGYEPNQSQDSFSFAFQSAKYSSSNNANSTELGGGSLANSFDVSSATNEENEELIRMMTDLETTKKALISEQQRVTELEEQLVAIIQENQTLQARIAQTSTNEEMKSVHDELSILDEVRQGTMCSRCLRSMDDRNLLEEGSSIAPTEDDDDRSILDSENLDTSQIYRSAVTIQMSKPSSLDLNHPPSPNPYRELVEKYEALLQVKREDKPRTRQQATSINDEQQTSGEYSSIHTKEGDDESLSGRDKAGNITLTNNVETNSSYNGSTSNGITNSNKQRKNCRRTPTEFSEAETSSSGFSDETSNKSTQTEERQGYFLCSIGDGEDCKFSIYDDASPIDSRFRNRPEYRELFKEIFAVLKKAAENKEEGEKLPLLDDTHPTANKVPPVTPANEEIPDFGDDTQSIISSAVSEQSVAMSECITKTERKTAKKHIIEKGQENKPPATPVVAGTSGNAPCGKQIIENGRVLTPLKREPLEYLTVGVGIKKKNRKKNRNLNLDRSDSPVLPTPPKIFQGSGKKRREYRSFSTASSQSTANRTPTASEWNGSSIIIYNRNAQQSPNSSSTPNSSLSKTPRELDMSGMEYKPSTVSQDLHKLKKLDLSYAEVLRRADACKHHHRRK